VHRSLDAGGVHLWSADIAYFKQHRQRWLSLLSRPEKSRHSECGSLRIGDEFLASRCLARSVLAEYVECDPAALVFDTNAYGKPSLDKADISFNISHSGQYLVLAVTRYDPVGVDVERRGRGDCALLARNWFTPVEQSYVASGSCEADCHGRFTEIWTAKEAYVKAIGKGLRYPFHCFSVAFESGARVNAEMAHRWRHFFLRTPAESPVSPMWEGFQTWSAPDMSLSLCVPYRAEYPDRPLVLRTWTGETISDRPIGAL
jgi:4'-phosphopantetheinyl transferase